LRGTSFRADLLDRLAFDVVLLPPLRARGEDVLLLANHFAARFTAELGREVFPGFTPAAEAALLAHAWPGNVRELRNVVERSLYRTEKPTRPLGELVFDPFGGYAAHRPAPAVPEPLPEVEVRDFRAQVDEFEKSLLRAALEAQKFNQKQAAAALGLSYHAFRNAAKKHSL